MNDETRVHEGGPVRLLRAMPTVAVTDIVRAERFYVSVFGFEKVFENGAPVGFMILRKDGVSIALSLDRTHEAPITSPLHLLVSDADAQYARCTSHGARIIKGLRNQAYGLRDFIVADPDGNRLEIGAPLAKEADAEHGRTNVS